MKLSNRGFLLLQVGIFLLGLSGSIYAAVTPANSMMNWYSNDDAFYYYKVAQNVLSGHGFSFDQINLSNGFHPLWMVVCLGVFWLSRFHLLLPLRILIIVSGILNGLTGIILLRLLKKFLPLAAALMGAAVWILLPAIYNNYTARGLESALSAFFITLLLLKSTSVLSNDEPPRKSDFLVLGLIAAFTILSRLDTLFVVAMIGFFVVFKIRRINRLLIFDLVAMLLASITAWILRFGTTPMILNNYSLYPQVIAAMAILLVALFFSGLYSRRVKDNPISFIVRLGVAGFTFAGLLYVVLLVLQKNGMNLLVSRSYVAFTAVLTFSLVALIRLFHASSDDPGQGTPWITFTNWIRGGLKSSIRDGVLLSLPIALLVGGYMLANKLVFNTFTPVSGQVKTWWGSLENTVYRQHDTLIDLLGLTPGSGSSPWSLLTTIVADAAIFTRNLFERDSQELPVRLFLAFLFIIFIVLVYLLSRKDGYLARHSFSLLIPAVAIGCFLHIAYYAARGYEHTRSWYWVPESMLLVLLGAVLSSRLFEKIRHWTRTPIAGNIILLIMVGSVFFLHSRYILSLCPASVSKENQAAYISEIRELEQYTEENSLIGMTGGGETAYFIQDRTIVNVDGLINSVEYFNALKSGTADKFLDNMNLDYVFGNPYMLLETDPYQEIFSGRVIKIGMIHGPLNFMLYQYGGH